MKLLDYLYYRAVKAYTKRGDSTPELMGELVVTVVIVGAIYTILTLLTLLFFAMPHFQKWHIFIVLLIVYFYVKYRYSKVIEMNKLDDKWHQESKIVKRKRGWLIIFVIILLFLFPILIGYLRHNLELNI